MQLHLHPILVHFPIALFITALLFEVGSFILRRETLHQTAVAVFIFAALFTPIVVLSGKWEAGRLNIHHPVLDLHQMFAFITMVSSLVSLPILWFVKRKNIQAYRMLFFMILLVVVCCVSIAAYNGGRMVYEYGVGIKE